MPRPIRTPGVQPLRELTPKSDLPQSGQNESKVRQSEIFRMNGKILVIGIGSFFLIFFVIESWLMRGLAH